MDSHQASKDKEQEEEDTHQGDVLEEEEKSSHDLDSSGDTDAFRKRQRQSSPSPSPRLSYSPAASPHKHSTFDELLAAADKIQTLSLAHELVMDDNFKLSPRKLPEKSVHKMVHDLMHKAFWDILTEQLEGDPPCYDHAIKLLGEVREMLLSLLLPQHERLKNQIMDVIDLDLIRQQAEHNALDVTRYSDFIVSIMGKLCAPVRDEEIKKLRETEGVVPLFREIFRVLDLMKLDMANFALDSLKPHLKQQSVEYERSKFKEFLETQQDGLEYTRRWLVEVKNSISLPPTPTTDEADSAPGAVKSDSSDPVNNSSPSESDPARVENNSTLGASVGATPSIAISPLFLLNQAYMELLHWDSQRLHQFPETMLTDQTRFMELGKQMDKACLIASILLVTYTNVGPAISGIQGLPSKVKYSTSILLEDNKDVKEVLPNIAEQVCSEVSACLKEHELPKMDKTRLEGLKAQIIDLGEASTSIRKLMDTRAKEFLLTSISCPAGTDLASKLPASLKTLQRQMLEVAALFSRLVRHNRSVYGPYYSEIIAKLLQLPK
ncbi:T-complex protein 11-like protein 1 [Holothuria leucospilota]|uniref:T-complex protein 11-like protein 1 n=1 Tax=Holothuria leucospilota TaxID=206669 RepID=A0A9Q1BTW4_HOLLE|nr:T-complex protein 11-like protein 1 [Holothuria leucospilota]